LIASISRNTDLYNAIMSTHTQIHTHSLTHTRTHTHIYTHIHKHTYIHTNRHKQAQKYVHTHRYIYIHTQQMAMMNNMMSSLSSSGLKPKEGMDIGIDTRVPPFHEEFMKAGG